MAKKYYDLSSERNLLRAILSNKDVCINAMTYELLDVTYFSDTFHKDCWKAIVKYFNKFGASPKEKHLSKYMEDVITYSNKYKSQAKQLDIWLTAVTKLYKPSDVTNKELKAEIDYLDNLRQKRLFQKSIVRMSFDFEKGKIDLVAQSMSNVLSKIRKHENIITQGNIVDDLSKHIKLDKMIKQGYFKPIPTGIVGVYENPNGNIEVVRIDDLLDGGLFASEMDMFVGEVNIGKSFILMEIPYFVAKVEKKNVILMTIEMNKIKAQRRV